MFRRKKHLKAQIMDFSKILEMPPIKKARDDKEETIAVDGTYVFRVDGQCFNLKEITIEHIRGGRDAMAKALGI